VPRAPPPHALPHPSCARRGPGAKGGLGKGKQDMAGAAAPSLNFSDASCRRHASRWRLAAPDVVSSLADSAQGARRRRGQPRSLRGRRHRQHRAPLWRSVGLPSQQLRKAAKAASIGPLRRWMTSSSEASGEERTREVLRDRDRDRIRGRGRDRDRDRDRGRDRDRDRIRIRIRIRTRLAATARASSASAPPCSWSPLW
jgi:hypothetical protein